MLQGNLGTMSAPQSHSGNGSGLATSGQRRCPIEPSISPTGLRPRQKISEKEGSDVLSTYDVPGTVLTADMDHLRPRK